MMQSIIIDTADIITHVVIMLQQEDHIRALIKAELPRNDVICVCCCYCMYLLQGRGPKIAVPYYYIVLCFVHHIYISSAHFRVKTFSYCHLDLSYLERRDTAGFGPRYNFL